MDTNFVPHKVDKLPEKSRVNTSKSIFTGELIAEMQSNPSDWYLVTRVEVPADTDRREMNNLRAGLYSRAQYRKMRYNPLMEYTVRLTDEEGVKFLNLYVRIQGNQFDFRGN
jgi:hypothetical protein